MKLLKCISIILLFLSLILIANSTQTQIEVSLIENVNQNINYNPLTAQNGTWVDLYEIQTNYNLSGVIEIKNQNLDGDSLFNIYITFDNLTHLSQLPVYSNGSTGNWIDNNMSDDTIILHIPELKFGENSYWNYTMNQSFINPPLNFSTSYEDFKLLSGKQLNIVDSISNNFNNHSYQDNTCIQDIVITQVTQNINYTGLNFSFNFNTSSLGGTDVNNASFTNNMTMVWNAKNSTCLYKNDHLNISYGVITPEFVPASDSYEMMNSSISYQLNQTISHFRVVDIVGESQISFGPQKVIEGPSHPTLYGTNVTWNVSSYFNSLNNISYNLTQVTLWVSVRNSSGSYTDPNIIDNDTISNQSLNISYFPNAIVNSTNPWSSSNWLFNYSDVPTPILWMEVDFEMLDDGIQLINRTITQNSTDFYIKEIYLIKGYWLEIRKNITSLKNGSYNVRINVHNKGNQVTPVGTVVVIYDFVPENFNRTSVYLHPSPWHTTTESNNTVNGDYNGTLFQWGLISNNALNTSLAQGPSVNENTTWVMEYNITGFGYYRVLDTFVTGLDPLQVDGAGSTNTVIVEQLYERFPSGETFLAITAGILLFLTFLF